MQLHRVITDRRNRLFTFHSAVAYHDRRVKTYLAVRLRGIPAGYPVKQELRHAVANCKQIHTSMCKIHIHQIVVEKVAEAAKRYAVRYADAVLAAIAHYAQCHFAVGCNDCSGRNAATD